MSELNYRKEEIGGGRKPIELETVNNLSKSICKIKYINTKNENVYGTGFFMKYKYLCTLITAFHVINYDLENKFIKIEIGNDKNSKKEIDLELKDRYIKYFEKPIDITVIELKGSDEININKEIEYLKYDKNYKEGYSQYKSMEVLCLGYPFGNNLSAQNGKILKIIDFEFEHDIPTEIGFSGSPIILSNILKVIGVHKEGDIKENVNIGTFIGKIFREINKDLKSKNIAKKEEDADMIRSLEIYSEKLNKLDIKNSSDLSDNLLRNNEFNNLINNDNILELDLSYLLISDISLLEDVKSKKLEILNLSHNDIYDISMLVYVNFEELKKLDLSYNHISNINKFEYVNFKDLKELDLSYNNLSDISILESVEFGKLQSLNLEGNNLKSINALQNSKFKELRILNLSMNNLTDIILFVLENIKFKKLEVLSISKNNTLSKINFLKNDYFKQLKELYLNNNKISDIQILQKVKFSKLIILNLANNFLENIDVFENTDFKELKKLKLNGNKISNIKILEKVQFDKIEILNLGNNYISDIKVFENIKFKLLKKLKLNNNLISDIKVLEKAKFDNLEILDFSNNEITDLYVLMKIDLKQLKELNFSGNKISDTKIIKKIKSDKLEKLII